MPCEFVHLSDGGTAIACSIGGRKKPCGVCGKPSAVLCDYPITPRGEKPRTCDTPCCSQHSRHAGPNLDYCLAHAALVDREGPPRLKL